MVATLLEVVARSSTMQMVCQNLLSVSLPHSWFSLVLSHPSLPFSTTCPTSYTVSIRLLQGKVEGPLASKPSLPDVFDEGLPFWTIFDAAVILRKIDGLEGRCGWWCHRVCENGSEEGGGVANAPQSRPYPIISIEISNRQTTWEEYRLSVPHLIGL